MVPHSTCHRAYADQVLPTARSSRRRVRRSSPLTRSESGGVDIVEHRADDVCADLLEHVSSLGDVRDRRALGIDDDERCVGDRSQQSASAEWSTDGASRSTTSANCSRSAMTDAIAGEPKSSDSARHIGTRVEEVQTIGDGHQHARGARSPTRTFVRP